MDKGTTIWLVGLSASGKSTLAKELVKYFENNGKKVQLIDGDTMREEIGGMFGYSRFERIKTATIYRTMAKLLNMNGINVVVAAISPYEEIREINRNKIDNYIEINVNCPIEECIKRDPKGLYKKALAGKEKYVIGIDEDYEFPKNSHIQVNTNEESIEESSMKIVSFLRKTGSILE
jgi:adenylylsulfate kinase